MKVSQSENRKVLFNIDEFEKSKSVKLRYRNCPSCGGGDISIFYWLESVPAHSVLLMPTYRIAVNYPRGDIYLGFCSGCGFVSNYGYEPELLEYSQRCEESQGFSLTFTKFHKSLANKLLDKYDLHNKDIVEIGCGKGEFLRLLCELGDNRGVGFDPAYVSGWDEGGEDERLRFVEDFYCEKYADVSCDFVCCKMTLEHIHDVHIFLSTVRTITYNRPEVVLFFQVPDFGHVSQVGAFWDIYYEHCSYFTEDSLRRLFEISGFEVLDLWRGYEGQYLMIEAKRAEKARDLPKVDGKNLESFGIFTNNLEKTVQNFKKSKEKWRNFAAKSVEKDRQIVVWGAGSKAVSFLNTLRLREEIEYAVDINHHMWGTFMAGTGQEIVGPEFLRKYQPDIIIIMNPIYQNEVKNTLNKMSIHPEIVTL